MGTRAKSFFEWEKREVEEMTKNEMVQLLYAEQCLLNKNGSEYCLSIAQERAEWFFKHHKPKKKREVLHVSESALEGMGEAILEGVKNSSCEPYIEWSRLRHALMNGKSVRLKK